MWRGNEFALIQFRGNSLDSHPCTQVYWRVHVTTTTTFSAMCFHTEILFILNKAIIPILNGQMINRIMHVVIS